MIKIRVVSMDWPQTWKVMKNGGCLNGNALILDNVAALVRCAGRSGARCLASPGCVLLLDIQSETMS